MLLSVVMTCIKFYLSRASHVTSALVIHEMCIWLVFQAGLNEASREYSAPFIWLIDTIKRTACISHFFLIYTEDQNLSAICSKITELYGRVRKLTYFALLPFSDVKELWLLRTSSGRFWGQKHPAWH